MEAFIIVDVQNDFCPGGSLAVPDGDAVIPEINRLREQGRFGLIAVSQDWHPEGHCSFASAHGVAPFTPHNGDVYWPDHCVQNTAGAALHSGLFTAPTDVTVRKGTARDKDAYSCFQGTDMADILKARGVTRCCIAGLALDFCIRHSALDAARAGFAVSVFAPGVRAVYPDKAAAVFAELEQQGIEILR